MVVPTKAGAVVIGAHINGLGVIRSLADMRAPIAVISTRGFDVAQHSRYVDEHHTLPAFHDDPACLVEYLSDRAAEWQGRALFPTNDDAVTVLAQHHETLSRDYCLTVQPWSDIRGLVDKDAMHELALKAGLNPPRCYGPTAPDLELQLSDYPVIIKPIQHDRLIARAGLKLFCAADAAELASACLQLADTGLEGLVYETIPGADSNIYVYCVYRDAGGRLSPGVTVRKLRQNPPGTGGARVAEIVPPGDRFHEALRAPTATLLQTAAFRGMAFVEYKLDPRTNDFRFIEVNPRAVLFNSILPPTGLDLVRMTWSDYVLGETPEVHLTHWNGVWIHLQADLFCSLTMRSREQLQFKDYLGPYGRPKTFAVWSLRDMRPFLTQTRQALAWAWRALLNPRVWRERLRAPGS